VGEILGGTQGFTVFLLHMLGPLPARLGASRDAETREDEEKPEEAAVRKQNQQIKNWQQKFGRYSKKQKPCSLAPESRPKPLRGIVLFGLTGKT
jgi:hypothetical protein